MLVLGYLTTGAGNADHRRDGPDGPEESSLLVPVRDVAAVVDEQRAELDPSAVCGVPAHVTVLYPFVPPELIDARLVTELEGMFTSVRPFPFHLRNVRWFGDEVAWLAPEPDTPFREMTELVMRRWPAYEPYGGVHSEVIPHLTIAEGPPLDQMRAAARLVAGKLPIAAVAREVWLMTGSGEPNSWSVRAIFPLAQRSAAR